MARAVVIFYEMDVLKVNRMETRAEAKDKWGGEQTDGTDELSKLKKQDSTRREQGERNQTDTRKGKGRRNFATRKTTE